ncbi:MAG: DEAD/DEAH box helicase, partial [Actinomycetota bacterium]
SSAGTPDADREAADTDPDATPDLEDLLTATSAEVGGEGGLVHLVRLPARGGRLATPDPPLHPEIAACLRARGIEALRTHQAEALAAIRAGAHTIVSTGTASGKSLCFNLPTFERILADDRARALYLYPTKALAQDQLRAIRAFGLPRVTAATFDGDTPRDERDAVRRFARIVLSNPDMLHFGILPQHQRWAGLLANLAYVVVDEAHVLRGVFGSHVGCILRRLRRAARRYGADPVFVMASATVGNPAGLAERLVGVPFTAVTEDGSPRGERLFAFWNPPVADEATGVRGSTNWESGRLLAALAGCGVHTIAFAKSRKAAELVAKHARTMTSAETAGRIRSYRAGYLASERREIERQLFAGELLGVAATSALELGIDVGALDAVVMNGFPGTVTAVWQQAGRAGRGGSEALAVLVGQDDPLDQYYLTHPDILLARPFEAALVDTTNPAILEPHLGCAAWEQPIVRDEVEAVFGAGAGAVADAMVVRGSLAARTRKPSGTLLHWSRRERPGAGLDLRSTGGPAYSIVDADTGALLGTVDGARVFRQAHPGAVYLHQGDNFEVVELDTARRVALVVPSDGGVYTQARDISDISVLEVRASKQVGPASFHMGRVEVREQVVSYARKLVSTGEVLEVRGLDLPEQVLETVAVWYTVEPPVLARAGIAPDAVPGSLHAAEHAAIGMLPLFAMADRWDIGGVSTAMSADTGLPTVFVYDGYPGGVGIAERGYEQAREHQQATLEVIRGCRCESGCPSCVHSPKCGNGNDPLDKHGAARLLGEILR